LIAAILAMRYHGAAHCQKVRSKADLFLRLFIN
jgi:hypothetical protein